MSTTYRHLIRQAQSGNTAAMEEMIEMFEGLIHHMAAHYNPFFNDYEESKAVGVLAFVEGIFNYDLRHDRPVPLHMFDSVRKGYNKERRRIQKQDSHVTKNFYDEYQQTWSDYPGGLIDAQSLSPDEIYVLKENLCLLVKGLEILTDLERQVIELRYYEGYSGLEIAATLDIHRNTVTKVLQRAKLKLLRFMDCSTMPKEETDVWNSIVESNGRTYHNTNKSTS